MPQEHDLIRLKMGARVRRLFAVICVLVTALATVSSGAERRVVYVRNGGSGARNGLGWNNAFAGIQDAIDALNLGMEQGKGIECTIRIASSVGGQAYAPAGYSGKVKNPLHLCIEGGYDPATDRRSGTSRIRGSGSSGTDVGLGICKKSGDHNESVALTVDRVIIEDVAVGVRIAASPSSDGIKPSITLQNSSITAGQHGIEIKYPAIYVMHGPSKFMVKNSRIAAGQNRGSTKGHAVMLVGPRPEVTAEKSQFTSGTGSGIRVEHPSRTGAVSSGNHFFIKVIGCRVTNCGEGGIVYHDTATVFYNTQRLEITLDGTHITGNAGYGIDVLARASKNQSGGRSYRDGSIVFRASDCVVSANGGAGIKLRGESVDQRQLTGGIEFRIVNCTLAGNGGPGLTTRTVHSGQSGPSSYTWPQEIRNTTISGNRGGGVLVADGDGVLSVDERQNVFKGNTGGNLVVSTKKVPINSSPRVERPKPRSSRVVARTKPKWPTETIAEDVALRIPAASSTASSTSAELAKGFPEVQRLRTRFNETLAAAEGDCTDSLAAIDMDYPRSLASLMKVAQSTGDLENVLKVRKEEKRFVAAQSVTRGDVVGSYAKLADLQIKYLQAKRLAELTWARKVATLGGQYARALDRLKKRQTQKGKFDEALAAKEELERAKSNSQIRAAKEYLARKR